eukprot:jgi/Tetstr1/438793/TSEL_027302.t1
MDAFRTPAPLPVDLPITPGICVNAQHDEQMLSRNEDQQTLRAYVPDPNLPWDPDGGHCKIGMPIPTAGLVKGHQCARCGTDDGHCSNDCMAAGTLDARVMRAPVAAKAGPAPVVGEVVRVPLAKEDRGMVDPRFLTCVMIEVTECNSYRVAVDAGVIKTTNGQQDLDQLRDIAPARVGLAGVVEKWSDPASWKKISLREGVSP